MTQSARTLKIKQFRAALFALATIASPGSMLASDPPANSRQTPIVKAIQAAEPAVVYIQGNKTVVSDGPGATGESAKPQVFSGMGTGIIIDSRGYIVTNNHVVADVAKIEVTLGDGSTHIAKLLTSDPKTDLALIKINVDRSLPVIAIGCSRDLMLGETVIAIGNPFGYQRTVTVGIVSGLHRNTPVNGSQDYKDLIQTNADINPGNSGGPLVNIEGEMIGINVAVRMGAQGIGFAIPVDSAIDVIASLVASSHKNPIKSSLQLRTTHDSTDRKLEVVAASSSSGLEEIEEGDCIVAIDGQDVRSRLDFELALLGRKIGEQMPITLQRHGKTHFKHITLNSVQGPSNNKLVHKEVPKEPSSSDPWEQLGIRVVEVGPVALRPNSDKYQGGLKITAVRPASPAANQKIEVGDILVGADGWKTEKMRDLVWVLNSPEFQRSNTANLYIVRGAEEWVGTIQRPRNIR